MASNIIRSKKASPNDRICRVCSRILATTSPIGDLVPAGTHDSACDTCKLFEELYGDVRVKDEAFKEVGGRRAEHGGRQKALEEARAAHKALDNFLIQVEMEISEPDTSIVQHPQPQDLAESDVKSNQQGQKRGLTSSTPRQAKRPRLESDTLRVRFDTSVVFHDETDGRPYQVFNRASEEYMPGRNAPSDLDGFLNTSGYGVAPGRFFGVRKHKKGWVETKEGREMDDLWRGVGDGTEESAGQSVKGGEEVEEEDEGGRFKPDNVGGGDGDVAEVKQKHIERLTTDEATEEEHNKHESPQTGSSKAQAASLSPIEDQSLPQLHPEEASPNRSENAAVQPTTLTAEPSTQQSLSKQSPTVAGEKEWTYGFGWNKKLSPKSRPRGEQWKPGFDESLPHHLKWELETRGRGSRRR
jgi:hypothetical protein